MAVGEAGRERRHLLLVGVAEVEHVELVGRVAREEEHVQEQRRAEQVPELVATELKGACFIFRRSDQIYSIKG